MRTPKTGDAVAVTREPLPHEKIGGVFDEVFNVKRVDRLKLLIA
jgi:hypothetical protein